jgi:hypothetical protein
VPVWEKASGGLKEGKWWRVIFAGGGGAAAVVKEECGL